MTTGKEQVITDKVGVNEESIEAVVLEGSKVNIFLKSGSVIPNVCVDAVHAQVRFEACLKALKDGAGYNNVTEVDDMDDYIKELAKISDDESSSEA